MTVLTLDYFRPIEKKNHGNHFYITPGISNIIITFIVIVIGKVIILSTLKKGDTKI